MYQKSEVNRNIILNNLMSARVLLSESLNLLIEENKDGNQFDYVNSPRLSDSFDAAYRTINSMERIIYQKEQL